MVVNNGMFIEQMSFQLDSNQLSSVQRYHRGKELIKEKPYLEESVALYLKNLFQLDEQRLIYDLQDSTSNERVLLYEILNYIQFLDSEILNALFTKVIREISEKILK